MKGKLIRESRACGTQECRFERVTTCTVIESPMEKGLENRSPMPQSMFPITSFAAKAVATPAIIRFPLIHPPDFFYAISSKKRPRCSFNGE